MKFSYFTLLFFCIALNSFGQYNDPNFPKPSSGYGFDGSHPIAIDSFPNPNYPGRYIMIYHPGDISTKVPTIFYNHAFGGYKPSGVQGLLDFVAKKGYAIVFVPYQTVAPSVYVRYSNLLSGFRQAARSYTNIIDTTRVGFMGYSFGGGACIANAYRCFTDNNWGQNGRFIYALAQWYSFNISQTELQSFPANTKLITQIFDDDIINDHRMAIDIFKNINIANSEKDFLLMRSDTVSAYYYTANHGVPNTSTEFDALDYYGIYRLLDALCDYTFNGNLTAKNVALGNGSSAQVTMPTGLKNLAQTDTPLVVYHESKYLYPCSDTQNVRSMYCPAITGIETDFSTESGIILYPNPATNTITVLLPLDDTKAEVKVYNSFGQLLFSESVSNQNSLTIDLSFYSKGVFFLTYGEMNKKFLIE